MAKTKGKTYITTSTPEVNLKYQDPYEHKTYDFIPAKEPERMNTNPNSPGFVHDTGIGRNGGLEYVQGIGYLGATLNSPEIVAGYERNAGGPPRRLITEDRRNLYSQSNIRPQTPAVYLYGFLPNISGTRTAIGSDFVYYTTDVFINLHLFMNVSTDSNPEWRLISKGDGRGAFGTRMEQSVIDRLRNSGTNIGLTLPRNILWLPSNSPVEPQPYPRVPCINRGFNFDGNRFMMVLSHGQKLYITPFSVGIQTQDDVAINVAGMREYVNNFTGTRASSEGINDIQAQPDSPYSPSSIDATEKAMNPVNTWVKQTGFQAPSPLTPTKGSKGLLGNCSTAGQVVTGLVVGGAIFALYKTCKK
jgi:hypothetical protein